MIPKFRAWDPYEEKMIDDKELVIWGGNIYRGDRDKIFQKIIKGKKGLIGYSFDDEYLMQSTGLKDKNGDEIFGGDVVMTTRFAGRADVGGGYYEYEKDYKGVVKMLEGCWLIDTGTDAVYLWSEIEENEVIGNIYENPELLESVEE